MEARAIAKYLRISPKKARLVADLVRGLGVNQAEAQLRHTARKASHLINKTLHSAISNAEHNLGLHRDNLYIKKISINEGPSLKRWAPRAFGRAAPIKKRSSHIEIILDELKPTQIRKIKKQEIAAEEAKQKPLAVKEPTGQEPVEAAEIISESPKESVLKKRVKTIKPKEKISARKTTGAIRKFFSRKAI